MENLIENANFSDSGDTENPLDFFSLEGAITCDSFMLSEHRSCSVTQAFGESVLSYLQPIDVQGRKKICFGFVLRAIDADDIFYTAKFYSSKRLLNTVKYPVTERVDYRFSRVSIKIPVPSDSDEIMLSVHVKGKITACTLLAPLAYYC